MTQLQRTLNSMSLLACLVSTIWSSAQVYAAEAERLYKTHCASCHGAQFQGSGLGPPLAINAYQYGGSEADTVRIVTNGIASKGMPSFKATLTEMDIAAIAQFIPAREKPEKQITEAFEKAGPEKNVGSDRLISTLDYRIKVGVVTDKLETPWALDFIDNNTILISERPGRLRLIKNGLLIKRPISGTPDVWVSSHKWNQGGLLDVAVDTDYTETNWVYLSFSHKMEESTTPDKPRGMLRVVRGKIKDHTWVEQQVIFEAAPQHYNQNAWHYGGRLLFDVHGQLFVSIGDRGEREQAREVTKPTGKIHRLAANGSIPQDNPFLNHPDALASLLTIGHRNPQGLALHPQTGELWASEHGPRGGDEINLIKSGADYGWPVASYGINYDGTILTPHTEVKGAEQPVFYWRPSIGVSGLAFYHGEEFPLWHNKLLVTGLATRDLRLLTVKEGRVLHQEVLMTFTGRPYEPVVGPDGAIYVVTDSPGQLLRISAVEELKL